MKGDDNSLAYFGIPESEILMNEIDVEALDPEGERGANQNAHGTTRTRIGLIFVNDKGVSIRNDRVTISFGSVRFV